MKKIVLIITLCFLFFGQGFAQSKEGTKWIKNQFKQLSLEQKIAQLMIIRAHSNWDVKKIDTLSTLIKKYNIGGLCFFQGGPVREAMQTNYYQSIAKTPLLITMDAEWGVGMRLDSVEMFPRQLSLGAISSDDLVYQMGATIAAQCKRLGIQVNYAPDVDINNNPSNPVINERSFGQNKQRVIQHGIAYMKGLQDNGVMATAKHFPGHGDVSVDSHVDIPMINKSMEQLTEMELAPFKALIEAGIESVMVGHLSVPAIDNRPKYATSLSSKAIHDLLKRDLGFKGITVTDALDMQAISNYFPKGEANVQAILAGNDMLCLPGDIGASIEKIKLAIKEKRITKKDINQRVKKVLAAKYKYGLHHFQPIDTINIIADLNKSVGTLKSQMAAKSLSFVKPSVGASIVLQKKTAYIALNLEKPNLLTQSLTEKYGFQIFYINAKDSSELETVKKLVTQFDQVIVGLHNYNRKPANHFEIPSQMIQFLNETHPSNWFHLIFGNPYAVGEFSKIQNILLAFEDNNFTQEAVLNWIEGKIQATGELPVTISEDMPYGTRSHPLKSSTSMIAPLKAKIQDTLYASVN